MPSPAGSQITGDAGGERLEPHLLQVKGSLPSPMGAGTFSLFPVTFRSERARRFNARSTRYVEGADPMAKGQEKPKTNNKPKLSVKEKKQKKKEKARVKLGA
jgi:hypothetical protein